MVVVRREIVLVLVEALIPAGRRALAAGRRVAQLAWRGACSTTVRGRRTPGSGAAPPHWMYLPSQGLLGHGLVVGDNVGPMDKTITHGIGTATGRPAVLTDELPRDERPRGDIPENAPHMSAGLRSDQAGGSYGTIRGRGIAPGSIGRAHSAAIGDHRTAEVHDGGAAIRGRVQAPGTRGSMDAVADRAHESRGSTAASQAQRRLDAKNAHLTESLKAHAERVSKRDAAGDRPPALAPADRIAALRRRVAGRSMGAAGSELARREDRQRALHQATGTAGEAEPEPGFSHQGAPAVGTSEVQKMHQICMAGAEFATTACVAGPLRNVHSEGSDAVGAAEDAVSGEGQVDHARAAAARRVAWHTAAPTGTPAGSAER